jgi:NDP-sugar pyrophosphorylase family protein/mannose-6-phosphate isomerase-like protein (cupin superfamily)
MGSELLKTIYKPWGKEEWIELNDVYCYKRIYINAGYKTSYQYHNFKRETNYIISGQAEVWLENDNGIVEKKIMKEGDYFNVSPPKKHRVIALTDLIMQEVSTPEVDDVIRINDEFNRGDGKIEGEHKKPAVLILCAGLGSRLKNLTKDINKTLLPINNKAIISHIIDMFPNTYDFVVTLGYKGDIIEEYCKITHPNHNFIFVDVENYEGEESGPGYSTLMCANYLQRPFYFITGDCLIDSTLPHIDGNWLGVQPTSFPEKYSTISIDDNDNIQSLINKNENGNDLAFIGLGGIMDYKIFWNELENNLKNGELVCAFENPFNYPSLKIKKLKWLDTGNLDDLEKTREYFNDTPLSLKKDISEITYKDGDKFLKFIPNKDILKRKVIRAKHLGNNIPNNFGFTDNFIHYDWVEGNTPYELDDFNVFNNFLKILEKKTKVIVNGNVDDIRKFYITKTKDRFKKFVQKYGTDYSALEHEINGVKRPSLENLLLDNNKFNMLDDNPFYSLFHGDLHFENMVYNKNEDKYYYIDWRDCFGDSVDLGDVYYDLSKFYGGLLIPYNLMKNEELITYTEGSYSVNYSYPISDNLVKFKLIYENWLADNGYDLRKVKFITGLIFLNMSPLHDGKFGKMLWFKSVEMLNDYDK